MSIDKSLFDNNGDSSFGGVIEFSNSRGIEVSRSNFTNNIVSPHAGVISMDTSIGFISCSHFRNNSVDPYGGIVKTDRTSFTNSSFTENRLDYYGGAILLDGSGDHVIVISCVFKFNTAQTGVICLDSVNDIQVLVSQFLHNTARRGTIYAGRSADGRVTLIAHAFLTPRLIMQVVVEVLL